MPPQPLSRVMPKAHLFLSAKLIHDQAPELAAKVAHAIALSALIENLFSAMLTTMLGAQAKPAAAMLRSLQSMGVKKNAIKAAADEALSDQEQLDLFNAVIDECDTATKHRHRFVHWAWAAADDGPGPVKIKGIAFIDPKALLSHEANAKGFMYPNEGRGLYDGEIDLREVLYYRESDLAAAVQEIERAHDHLSALRMVVINGQRAERQLARIYHRLLAAPEIAKRLDKIRAQRKSAPEEPTQ